MGSDFCSKELISLLPALPSPPLIGTFAFRELCSFLKVVQNARAGVRLAVTFYALLTESGVRVPAPKATYCSLVSPKIYLSQPSKPPKLPFTARQAPHCPSSIPVGQISYREARERPVLPLTA